MVLFIPTLESEPKEALTNQIKEIITKNAGSVGKQEDIGKKKLAYDIKGNSEGIYFLQYFDTEDKSIVLDELDRFCRYNESILRHIIVKPTKVKISKRKIKREKLSAKRKLKEEAKPVVQQEAPAQEESPKVAE